MPADTVTACVHIAAPPERVYEYFTRPEAIVSWMGEYALLEAEPGGRFVLDIKGAPVRGRFLELDPPRRLLISWGYAGSDHLPPGASTVEVRLTADRGGTRVELQHRDLPPRERPGHASGWTHYLTRLESAASAAIPAPIPACHRPCRQKTHRNAQPGCRRQTLRPGPWVPTATPPELVICAPDCLAWQPCAMSTDSAIRSLTRSTVVTLGHNRLLRLPRDIRLDLHVGGSSPRRSSALHIPG